MRSRFWGEKWMRLRGGSNKKHNPFRGMYDEGLATMLRSHGNNPALVLDTVLEFLTRESGMPSKPGLQAMIQGILDRNAGGHSAPPVDYRPPPRHEAPTQSNDAYYYHETPPQRSSKGPPQHGNPDERGTGRKDPFYEDVEMPVKIYVTPEARKSYQQAVNEEGGSMINAGGERSVADGEIKIGTKCKHHGCNHKYQGPESEKMRCKYHPGGPVFHEGEKYWSCCRRRTINFVEFLSTPGCATGRCTYTEEKTVQVGKHTPRYDMMESGTEAYLAIYAKKVDPASVKVYVSRQTLKLHIIHDLGRTYDIEVKLNGLVIPHMCKVELSAPRLEICLKKGDGTHWGTIGTVYDKGSGLELVQRSEFALPNA